MLYKIFFEEGVGLEPTSQVSPTRQFSRLLHYQLCYPSLCGENWIRTNTAVTRACLANRCDKPIFAFSPGVERVGFEPTTRAGYGFYRTARIQFGILSNTVLPVRFELTLNGV